VGIDMKCMRRTYDENQRGGDIWTADVGVTMVYIHGQCREDGHEPTKGLNHVPVVVHYGLGRDGRQMVVCLDQERNPIVTHPFVKAYLKSKGVKIGKKCPVCRAIESGEMDADQADRSAPTTRFLWGVTPIAHKPSKSSEGWNKLTPKPQCTFVGSTLYNGFMDLFFENGDITDLDQATFALIYRTGKGQYDTKYEVKIDPATLKSPKKIPGALRRVLIKSVSKDGDCDLFRIVANMVKSTEDIKGLLSGATVDTSEGDDDDFDEGDLVDDDSVLGDDELDDGGDGLDDDGDGLDDDGDDGDDFDGDDGDEGDDFDGELDDGDDLLGEDGDEAAASEDTPEDTGDDEEEAEEAEEDTSGDDDDDLGLDELDAELERVTKKAIENKAKKAGKLVIKPAKKRINKKAKA